MKRPISKYVLALTLTFSTAFGWMATVPVATVATVSGIAIVATLPATTGFVGCSKDQLVASAKDVVSVLKSSSVQNALSTLAPDVLAKVIKAIPTAERLVEAVRQGDFSDATNIVNSIFPLIDEVADALKASPKVLAFVALANIALHFIINHVQNVPEVANMPSTPATQRTAEFRKRPVWGCTLRADKRCAALVQ